MMEAMKDGYRLSTGKEFYANCGILGISHEHPWKCSEGYDGSVDRSWPAEEWWDEECKGDRFTQAEREEIADYMITLWAKFKRQAEAI